MPNSDQERIVLNRFRECWKEFPQGKIVKSEAPDFIIKNGRKHTTGIELTSLPEEFYEISPRSKDPFLSDLVKAISGKTTKLRSYQRNRYHEYWLVVHVESLTLKLANFDKLLEHVAQDKGFDRVFLIALFEGKVWELFNLS